MDTANKRVSSQLVFFPKKNYYLKTVSGRKLVYHEKEYISTLRGEIDIKRLRLTDQVLLSDYNLDNNVLDEDKKEITTILDEDDFLGGVKNNIPREKLHLLDQDLIVLSNLKLIPLKSDHPKLHIIARLIGALLTDGCISKFEAVFTVGCFEDAICINDDIERLGFKSNTPKKYTGKYIGKERIINHKVFLTRKGGSFVRFMILLGSPVGRKTTQSFKLPEWIMNSSKMVKREFLGAFLGGDGPSPWYYPRKSRKSSFKITMTKLLMHKAIPYVDAQMEYFREVSELFQEFKIEIRQIKQTALKGSVDKNVISIHFKTSKDNIFRLCRNIGYRYCKEKHIRAFFISEYLAYRREEIKKRMKLTEKILILWKNGETHKSISNKLKVDKILVKNTILRKHKTRGRKQTLPISSWNIKQFFDKSRANQSLGHLYIPLESKQSF